MGIGANKPNLVLRAASVIVAAAALMACRPSQEGTATALTPDLPPNAVLASLPLAELAGAVKDPTESVVGNPLEGDKQAIAAGHRLFIAMNCAGCHGYDAAGNMGPDLTDKAWRYGGTPAAIYKSIFEGRPQGMPSWGQALPAQDIWKLVAFIQSYGGSYAAGDRKDSLNGDHGVTSVAPEVTTIEPTFNLPALRDLGNKATDASSNGGNPTPASGDAP
jgi:cytochrome c oxidase cbb3-type subunit III